MSPRRDPFEQMERMIDQMRDAMARNMGMGAGEFSFDSPYGRGSFRTSGDDANLTMEETEGGFVVLADLPGFEKEEIDLRIDGDSLLIRADRDATEGDERTFARQRRSVSERISIPEAIVESEVSATYRNGVLEVHLPIDAETHGHSSRIDID